MKTIATGILTTIFLGLSAFAGRVIFDNAKSISSIITKEDMLYDDVKEIKHDIKTLIRRDK